MTSLGPLFCPRCGTARLAAMPYCPRCGLNVAEFDEAAPGTGRQPAPTDAPYGASIAQAAMSQSSSVDDRERGWPSDAAPAATTRPPGLRGLRVHPGIIVVLIVIGGLIVLGILPRPQLGASSGAGRQAVPPLASGVPPLASGVPAAPIVGLTILSPTDGQAVASKDVVVIGMAPPGLTITQDISFGLDQHAKVDGTGHWSINVGLNEGDNKLNFRIGDDNSTKQTIRVIYTPQKAP